MPKFQIVHYGEDAAEHLDGVKETRAFNSDSAAKSYAGRLSKRIKGPVDIARAPGIASILRDDWADRYITTAAPSPHHASGYRFERLT